VGFLLEIEEIGSTKKSQGTQGKSAREAEVRRMAQSLATESLAGQQGATQGHAVSGAATLQEDAVKLSDRALTQVGRSEPGAMNRRDKLRDSLLDKLNKEIVDPNSDFNRENKKAEGGGDNKKRKKVERKKEWDPIAQPGQIHEGREVIGKIRVTEEVKEEGGDGVGAVGKAGGGKSGSKAASPQGDGKANAAKPTEARSSQSSADPKDQKKEAQDASAAQNMEKSGLKVEGMDPSGQAKAKGEEQSAQGGGKVGEFDVKGRAFGTTQTLTMTPAKELQPEDKSLGTFRKLDDKPMLKYVTLHSKNTTDAAAELKKNATAAGESPEEIQRAVEKLKDKSQP
jgi:hypothetical protein